MSDRNGHPTEHFPDDGSIVPPLLTPAETARILRLDIVSKPDGTEEARALGDALRSLDRLVGQRKLTPRRFGKSRTYARQDVFNLILAEPDGGE